LTAGVTDKAAPAARRGGDRPRLHGDQVASCPGRL